MRLQTIFLSLLLAGIGLTDSQARTAKPTIPMESVFIMQVDGWIVIDPHGKVASYQRDTTVPANLVGPIDRAVRGWLFKPVLIDGAPAQAKAKMRVTLAAQKTGDTYKVRVDNVTFPSPPDEPQIMADGKPFAATIKKLKPPEYPGDLLMMGISGKVLLGLKIGLDGRVEECVALQTALLGISGGKPALLSAVAERLQQSAVEGAKKWRFTIDMEHGTPTVDRLSATVSINYVAGAAPFSSSGKWRSETRTALVDMPWLPSEPGAARVGVSDASDGEIAPVANAMRLLSDPNGTAL